MKVVMSRESDEQAFTKKVFRRQLLKKAFEDSHLKLQSDLPLSRNTAPPAPTVRGVLRKTKLRNYALLPGKYWSSKNG